MKDKIYTRVNRWPHVTTWKIKMWENNKIAYEEFKKSKKYKKENLKIVKNKKTNKSKTICLRLNLTGKYWKKNFRSFYLLQFK